MDEVRELITVARELTASVRVAVKGRTIKMGLEVRISGKLYVSGFCEAVRNAGKECVNMKSKIIDVLEEAGIFDSKWDIPVVIPSRGGTWVTLSAETDEEIPKDVAREIMGLRV